MAKPSLDDMQSNSDKQLAAPEEHATKQLMARLSPLQVIESCILPSVVDY
jgi:hypothetical protein